MEEAQQSLGRYSQSNRRGHMAVTPWEQPLIFRSLQLGTSGGGVRPEGSATQTPTHSEQRQLCGCF